MLDLSRKLDDKHLINGKSYVLDLSFNNVIKLFEMFNDDEVDVAIKMHLALRMLTKVDFSKELTIEEAANIYSDILQKHIKIEDLTSYNSIETDLAGNPLPTSEKQERVYSLFYDSDYIFASFFQAYKIDLIEEQGKLHWKKFNALLSGLPDNTKFVEVIKIRKWKPQKGDSTDYKNNMRELQKQYALPDE